MAKRELLGEYGFNRCTRIGLVRQPRGNYTSYVSLYDKDSRTGKYMHKTFSGQTPEESVEKAMEFLGMNMNSRPTLVKVYSGSIRFPVRIRTEDDEVKEIVDKMIMEAPWAKRLSNPPTNPSNYLPDRTYEGGMNLIERHEVDKRDLGSN